jgi:hypothetical protein
MLTHLGMTVMGLEALTHLIRTTSDGHRSRWLAALATFAVLMGKFVVIHQAPGLPVDVRHGKAGGLRCCC